MRIRFDRLLHLLSAILVVATALLWWRSYTHGDSIGLQLYSEIISVSTHPGGFSMEVCDWIPEGTRLFQFDTHPWGIFDIVQPSAPQQDEHSEMATVVTTHYEFEMYDWRRPNWMFLGFGAGRLDQPLADNSLPPVRTWLLLIPYWFVIAVLFGFTAYGFRSAWTHRRREQLGLCLNCGYDLRASNDKCPECGTEIPKPAGQVHDSV